LFLLVCSYKRSYLIFILKKAECNSISSPLPAFFFFVAKLSYFGTVQCCLGDLKKEVSNSKDRATQSMAD